MRRFQQCTVHIMHFFRFSPTHTELRRCSKEKFFMLTRRAKTLNENECKLHVYNTVCIIIKSKVKYILICNICIFLFFTSSVLFIVDVECFCWCYCCCCYRIFSCILQILQLHYDSMYMYLLYYYYYLQFTFMRLRLLHSIFLFLFPSLSFISAMHNKLYMHIVKVIELQ